MCTQFSTHTYLFFYSGQLDPPWHIGLSCFSLSQQRHVLWVLASLVGSLVCFFFHLSTLLFLSAFLLVALFLCPALSPCLLPFLHYFPCPLLLFLSFTFSPSSVLDWGIVLYVSWLLPLTLSYHDGGLLQHTIQHVGCWAWDAQAFALYNCAPAVAALKSCRVWAPSPAHSGRFGPSASMWMYSRIWTLFQSNQFWRWYRDLVCVLKFSLWKTILRHKLNLWLSH